MSLNTRRYYDETDSYNQTSSALAYDRTPYYYEEENKRIENEAKREEKLEKTRRRIHHLKLTFAVCIVFGGCILTMLSYAAVTKQRVINGRLSDKLTTLQSENVALEAEVIENADLAFVEKEAKMRLGMSEPQSYQIVYIDVPKKSYTVQYEVEQEESTKFSLAGLANIFKK